MNEVLSETALLKRYAKEIRNLKHNLEQERKTDKAQEVEQVSKCFECIPCTLCCSKLNLMIANHGYFNCAYFMKYYRCVKCWMNKPAETRSWKPKSMS